MEIIIMLLFFTAIMISNYQSLRDYGIDYTLDDFFPGSFMIIGFGSDLEAFNVKGYGWPLAGGVILLILSILILINPFSFGTSAVVILTGIALIIMGGILIVKSLRMRNLHSFFKSLDR